jgi:microcystin degradation protein MlrC
MEFFRMRKETQPGYTTLDQALARAASHNQPKPLVLADVSDNAGGGAASDSTFILKALLDRGIRDAAIAMFWDPMAVRIGFEVGEGAEVDLRLGGKLGPMSGPALDVRARVIGLKRDARTRGFGNGHVYVGDMAAFDVNGIAVVCNTLRAQCKSVDAFTNVGIDPSARKVVVVKSMQHFHAEYAPVSQHAVREGVAGAVALRRRSVRLISGGCRHL